MRAVNLIAVGTMLLGLMAGCDRDRSARTNTTSGNPNLDTPTRTDDNRVVPNRDMREDKPGNISMRFNAEVDRLASARCDREVRCNNVGGDHKWKTREHCLSDLRASMKDELNQWDCKGGINNKELEECLTEIHNENCGNPLDTVGRLVACRSSDMCNAVP